MIDKPNKKNGAIVAIDIIFLNEFSISLPTKNCPFKLSEEPFIADATTRIIPTPAIVKVSTV